MLIVNFTHNGKVVATRPLDFSDTNENRIKAELMVGNGLIKPPDHWDTFDITSNTPDPLGR